MDKAIGQKIKKMLQKEREEKQVRIDNDCLIMAK
jgi:hypothetical protein